MGGIPRSRYPFTIRGNAHRCIPEFTKGRALGQNLKPDTRRGRVIFPSLVIKLAKGTFYPLELVNN
jgi:hypothetical protein